MCVLSHSGHSESLRLLNADAFDFLLPFGNKALKDLNACCPMLSHHVPDPAMDVGTLQADEGSESESDA